MFYQNTKIGKFISRPNRFIAHVELAGEQVICHVKNTGRCKELLLPGVTVILEKVDNPKRKTQFDLISVYKGDRLINMDSQAPNKIFSEWVLKGKLFPGFTLLKPEFQYHNSRLDFYIEVEDRKNFVEVKGVTLEENGVAMFPDAPTERGVKHIHELIECRQKGFEAYMVFIIQMKQVRYFTPNIKTHQAFGEALKAAEEQGVKLLALDCEVTENTIAARNPVEIKLR